MVVFLLKMNLLKQLTQVLLMNKVLENISNFDKPVLDLGCNSCRYIEHFYNKGWFVSLFKTGLATFVYLTIVIPIAFIIIAISAFMFY